MSVSLVIWDDNKELEQRQLGLGEMDLGFLVGWLKELQARLYVRDL